VDILAFHRTNVGKKGIVRGLFSYLLELIRKIAFAIHEP
jgi:hypothetical protein